MMPDAAVWEDIRVAYETTSETKRDIAARFGVSEGAIYRHAKKEGWTLRPSGADGLLIIGAKRAAGITGTTHAPPPTKKGTRNPNRPSPFPLDGGRAGDGGGARTRLKTLTNPALGATERKRSRGGGSETHQRAIIKRLYDVTDAKLSAIENRIASAAPLKAADAERESREIASILKTIEKLKELLDAFARTNAKSGEPKPGTAAANAAASLADDAERLRQDLAERFARLKDSDTNSPPAE